MGPYLELARAEFRRYSTYRLAIAAGVFTNTVFGLIKVGVLFGAIAAAGGKINGYDQRQAATYVWLGQALLAPVAMYAWSEVADRVRTGEIAVDLARPVDLQLSYWARDLGRAALALPTRGLPPLVLGALLMGLAYPASWTAYPLGLVSIALGVSVSFLCRYGVNLIAFWTLDVRGYLNLYTLVLGLFSGFYLPVHIFPDWLRGLAYASPFPSMFQSPIDVLSGRVLGWEACRVLAVQSAWLVGLVVLTRLVLWRAARRLVVQGG
ncbi:ABC transporter permease [uncultured Friedmanniella sp.]|uniref:ABC transporter permease n=1 Tax=uncultured Friedmanniella sp. TaxID=335381 RepID=UPI0035C95F7E